MRRFSIHIGLFVVVVLVGGLMLIRYQPQDPSFRTDYDKYYLCPIALPAEGVEVEAVDWELFVSDPQGLGPRVQVKDRGIFRNTCSFDITRTPIAPFTAVDWRIGHSIEDFASLRGQDLIIRFSMRSSKALKLPTARAYSYDGQGVYKALVPELDQQLREFTWTHKVPLDADRFEIWFRLAIHGDVSDEATITLNGARVEIAR